MNIFLTNSVDLLVNVQKVDNLSLKRSKLRAKVLFEF